MPRHHVYHCFPLGPFIYSALKTKPPPQKKNEIKKRITTQIMFQHSTLRKKNTHNPPHSSTGFV